MKWLVIWRRWVAWQRSLFISLATKRQINWLQKLNDLLKILKVALESASQSHPDLEAIKPEPKPEPEPTPQPEKQNPYDLLTTGNKRVVNKHSPRSEEERRRKN